MGGVGNELFGTTILLMRDAKKRFDWRKRESLHVNERVEREYRSGFRKSLKGRSFRVESKVFEIEVDEKKGRLQAIIMERKRGISLWVKLGQESLGSFWKVCFIA